MRATRASDARLAGRTALALALALAAAVPPARAADPPSAPAPQGTPSATRGSNLKLGEVEIQGELEKPDIFFILPKAERDAASRERHFRFYPDVLEPLDRDRFEEEARVLYQHGIPAE